MVFRRTGCGDNIWTVSARDLTFLVKDQTVVVEQKEDNVRLYAKVSEPAKAPLHPHSRQYSFRDILFGHRPVSLHRIYITLVFWYPDFRHFSYLRFGLYDDSQHSLFNNNASIRAEPAPTVILSWLYLGLVAAEPCTRQPPTSFSTPLTNAPRSETMFRKRRLTSSGGSGNNLDSSRCE